MTGCILRAADRKGHRPRHHPRPRPDNAGLLTAWCQASGAEYCGPTPGLESRIVSPVFPVKTSSETCCPSLH